MITGVVKSDEGRVRLKVEGPRKAVESCNVVEYLRTANLEDIDEARFNVLHREWCMSIMDSLRKADVSKVAFGRAAK